MNVLVVAAHPDDEVLGCGGTMLKHVSEGDKLYIAILGEGITSRYDNREEADKDLLDLHTMRCRKAAQALGAEQLFTYQLPDNRFDTISLLEIVKIIEQLIDSLEPDILYTHHGGDLNIDHVLTHRAVLTATRPTADNRVKQVYAFEIPSSTEWAFAQCGEGFQPNTFVEIEEHLEAKIAAMELYESEARKFPHPRSPEALHAIAKRWGSAAGLGAAEAFVLVRSICN